MDYLSQTERALPDGGVWYAETDPGQLIVEPWNAFSSTIYILVALIWAYRLRGRYQEFIMLDISIVFLFFGGLGSTLYHAFRSHPFFLYLDWVPVALLSFLITIYFWHLLLPRWWQVPLVFLPFLALIFILNRVLIGESKMDNDSTQFAINVGYFLRGFMMFLPILLLEFKIRFKYFPYFILTVFFFGLSLWFRKVDQPLSFLPMGTHWLWHVFSAAGAWFLGEYLYRFRLAGVNNQPDKT